VNTIASPYGSSSSPLDRPYAELAVALGAAVVAGLASGLLGTAALALAVGALALTVLVRRPLALLAAFLAIGVFKGTPVLPSLPIDATLALALPLAGVCAVRLVTGRALAVPLTYVMAFLAIGTMLVLSLGWTPVEAYGTEKALKFWTLTLLAAFAPFFLIEDESDIRELLAWILATAVLAAAVTLLFGEVDPAADTSNANTGRLEFGGVENTIFISRLMCVGAIIALFAPTLGLGGRWRYGILALGIGLVAVAASVGSRGPIVSLVLALACTLAAVATRSPRAVRPLVAMVLVAAAVFPFISLPETSAARLRGVADDPLGTLERDGRSGLYRQAVALAEEHPLTGIGAGGFSVWGAIVAQQQEDYPHNLFLEAASELGVAAAVVLLAMVIAVLVRLYRQGWAARSHRRRMLVHVVTAVLLFGLFAAQFSGDLNGNRMLWTALGLGWLVAAHGVPEGARPREETPPAAPERA
jgi:O-antigen ligase